MAGPGPHGERVDGTSVVGGAVGRPGESGGKWGVKVPLLPDGPHSTHFPQGRQT